MMLKKLKLVAAAVLLVGAIGQTAPGQDSQSLRREARAPDSDGDGLSDYQEIHKYRTDPNKFSTAGDGVSDGDWQRRREFTYSIRTVIKVMPPVNFACLDDDYQDARVLARGDQLRRAGGHPLPAQHQCPGRPRQSELAARRRGHGRISCGPASRPTGTTRCGATCSPRSRPTGSTRTGSTTRSWFSAPLAWLLANSKFRNMFCTHYIHFPGRARGDLSRPRGQVRSRRRETPAGRVQEQLEHELFGRSMFASRTHGSCTSTAIYLTTVLRALGIPTRMVLALPLVDANDAAQLAMVRDGPPPPPGAPDGAHRASRAPEATPTTRSTRSSWAAAGCG